MFDRLTRRQLLFAGIVTGVIGSGLLALAGASAVVGFGLYDVSASKQHGPLVAWLLHTAMIRSVRVRARDGGAPQQFSRDQVVRGLRLYDQHCAVCHGGPGLSRAAWVKGLEPTPPYLLDASRRWSPAELRFIISNGVKMTAMPSWKMSRSHSDLTDLVAFLEAVPAITPQAYAKMRAAPRP